MFELNHVGQPLGNLVGHPNSVEVVKFSPDGTKIVSGSQGADNNLIVWTILTNQEEIILKNIHRLYGNITISSVSCNELCLVVKAKFSFRYIKADKC